LRNAVGHGIETPEVRRALGKPPTGRIRVRVAPREGHRIEVSVGDDGGGIDPAQVREAALRGRVVPGEALDRMGDSELVDLVYRPGLSTTPIITDIFGHGLGLAIVAERVTSLDGDVSVETEPGGGTCFRLDLPASIEVTRGL